MSEATGRGTWPLRAAPRRSCPRLCALSAPSPRRRTPPAGSASGSRTTPGSSTGPARSTTGSTGSSGSASISSASTCTGTRSRRSAASPTGRTATRCSRACEPRGIAVVVGLVGSPRWANGGRTPNFAPGARVVRRLRARRGDSLPLGEAVARLERAEPGALAAPDDAGGLRAPDSQPGLRRDPRGDPGRQGGRRRHGAARLDRRRLAGRLDPRHAQRRRPARRLRAPPVSVEHPRDAVHRRLRPLHDDHDGDARAAPLRGRPRVRAEADLADRVRLPDGPLRRQPAAPGRADRRVRPPGRTRRRASTC